MSAAADAPLRDAAWLWREIRQEAVLLSRSEPVLASFFHISLLNHAALASALAFLLGYELWFVGERAEAKRWFGVAEKRLAPGPIALFK